MLKLINMHLLQLWSQPRSFFFLKGILEHWGFFLVSLRITQNHVMSLF